MHSAALFAILRGTGPQPAQAPYTGAPLSAGGGPLSGTPHSEEAALSGGECNVLSGMSVKERGWARAVIVKCILATDASKHFGMVAQLQALVKKVTAGGKYHKALDAIEVKKH